VIQFISLLLTIKIGPGLLKHCESLAPSDFPKGEETNAQPFLPKVLQIVKKYFYSEACE